MVWAVKEVSSLMSFFLPGGLWVLARSNCQRFLKFLRSWCHNPSEKEVTSFARHVPIIVEFKALKNLLWQSQRKRSSFWYCNCLSSFSFSLTSSRLSPARNLQADLQKVPKLTENVWSVYKDFLRRHQFTLNKETLQAILECHIGTPQFRFLWHTMTFTHTFRLNVSFWSREDERPDSTVLQAVVGIGSSALIPYFVSSVLCQWNIMQEYALTNPRSKVAFSIFLVPTRQLAVLLSWCFMTSHPQRCTI